MEEIEECQIEENIYEWIDLKGYYPDEAEDFLSLSLEQVKTAFKEEDIEPNHRNGYIYIVIAHAGHHSVNGEGVIK